VTYAPPSFIAVVALISAALFLSPLGRIGPSDAIAVHAPWVERQATFTPWTSSTPPPTQGPYPPEVQRTGTIDALCYTFTFTEYADPAYLTPYSTQITKVQTHYLLLIPALLTSTLFLLAIAWAWKRIFQSRLALWLPPFSEPN
jgi:hypothetical protein